MLDRISLTSPLPYKNSSNDKPGADLGFSRGGVDFQKKSQAKFRKKSRPKRAFLGTFWKSLTEKLHFFGAHYHLKINILAPKTPLETLRIKMDNSK